VQRLDLLSVDGDTVSLSLDCSAGFYVRALAHDLGERLGVGGHLTALRRTRSGDYSLDDAVGLEAAERDAADAATRLIPLARMLPRLPAAQLTADGVSHARHGRDLEARDFTSESEIPKRDPLVRLLDDAGDLVALAEPAIAPALLHPFVVLM
jgi:tRNA pseudouridine55 synthase